MNIYVQLLPAPFGRVSLGIIIGSKILTAFQLIIHRAASEFQKHTEPIYKPAERVPMHAGFPAPAIAHSPFHFLPR